MRKTIQSASLVLAVFFSVTLLQSCVIDTHRDYCEYKTVCSTDCFGRDCYTVCDDIEVCYENDYRNPECRYHNDCVYGYCSNGECFSQNTNSVPACGTCSRTGDCYDNGAVCARLGSGEQVCLRPCNSSMDCYTNFSCVPMLDAPHLKQCVPNSNSCEPSYCTNSNTCVNGSTCINNRCVYDFSSQRQCETNAQCQNLGADVCVSTSATLSYCSIRCNRTWDCNPGMACVMTSNDLNSGVCMPVENSRCTYNSNCQNGFVCYSGECKKTCNSPIQCGNGLACINNVCQ